MAEKRTGQPKIYLVVGLSIVLVVVAYFRFFHKKATHAPAPARSKAGLARLDVPQIQIPNPYKTQLGKLLVKESARSVTRDIFKPLKAALQKGEAQTREQQPSKPTVSLKLKGTIVGGEKAIAVINDQFVRTGDWIGEYKVVKIGKKDVLLDSGNEKIKLEMVKDE